MINDLRKGFTLLKYTYSFKKNMIAAALFLVFGCIAFYVSCAPVGAMFIVESWMFVSNLISEFEFSPMILTSPNRKKYLLTMQDIVVTFSTVFSLAFIMVVSNMRGFTETHPMQILCAYLMLGCMVVYISLLNKSQVLTLCVMAILIVLLLVGLSLSDSETYMNVQGISGDISANALNVVGVASFVIGNIAGFILRRALYKWPMSATHAKRYEAMMKG